MEGRGQPLGEAHQVGASLALWVHLPTARSTQHGRRCAHIRDRSDW